jgi:hypothetical protein
MAGAERHQARGFRVLNADSAPTPVIPLAEQANQEGSPASDEDTPPSAATTRAEWLAGAKLGRNFCPLFHRHGIYR